MPVDVVANSKHVQFASGAFERSIWIVACRFWLSGASLDGFTETTAREVAKADGATWNRIKTPLMAALGDILPELATARAIAQEKRDHMARVIQTGANKGRIIAFERRRLAKLDTVGKFADEIPDQLRTPQKATRHVNEAACMSPQKLAALETEHVEARLRDE